MSRSKVEFENPQGAKLAGLLEMPDQGEPRTTANHVKHLFDEVVDAEYIADTLVAWSSRYL